MLISPSDHYVGNAGLEVVVRTESCLHSTLLFTAGDPCPMDLEKAALATRIFTPLASKCLSLVSQKFYFLNEEPGF